MGGVTSDVLVPKKSITTEANQSIADGDILFYELDLEDALEDLEEESDDLPPLQEEGCKTGTSPDGMGGCAVYSDEIYSVFVDEQTAFDFQGIAGNWNSQYVKFYHYGDTDSNCIVDEDACVEISDADNADTWSQIGEMGQIVLATQGGLTTESGITDCNNDMFFVYGNDQCTN